MDDPFDSMTFDLARFTTAQEPVIASVLAELRAGRKRTHWMWFIFPQLRGLGVSSMATFYGIVSFAEARAYLADPTLGPRLKDCTEAVLQHAGTPLRTILGSPDDMKFRSCMTLFTLAGGEALYRDALDRFCGGLMDERTVALVEGER